MENLTSRTHPNMAGMLTTAEVVSKESIGASKQAEAVQLSLGLLELSKHTEAVQLKTNLPSNCNHASESRK